MPSIAIRKTQRRSFKLRPSGFLAGIVLLAMMSSGVCQRAFSQSIINLSPSTVTQGCPSFTLTVTGSGFIANSVVQVNGSNRPTMYVSALQVTATILASDVATPAMLHITVFNPSGAGGTTSNTATLTVTGAPSPSLLSVSPGFTSQSADSVRMTLVGANFRPGATVVVSPPLTSLASSDGHTRANDVIVNNVTVVNPGVITAIISIRPTAVLGLRAVDVLNFDGTSTAGGAIPGGSSQALRVEASNSLGAPLSVLHISISHPRDGTVVMQGGDLSAEAVLAGTGTGTVTGEWLWDGKSVEQFSVSIVGGRSTAIQPRQSFPTWSLGTHTVQLHMLQPNGVASRPVQVVVNPGNWKLGRLILPAYGAVFASSAPPSLQWTPIPGAMKYQVGFSTKPYLSTIQRWFDAVDNRCTVPLDFWKSLPEGVLYWTVRAVDTSGNPRKALPMRLIYRTSDGSLTATTSDLTLNSNGHTQLQWIPISKGTYYFVTISRDMELTHVLRRYLTAEPKLDLHALEGQLAPGTTYFWKVSAISKTGRVAMAGPVQQFIVPILPRAVLHARASPVLIASLGRPDFLPYLGDGQAELAITNQTPAPDSSIDQTQPQISAAFPQTIAASDVSITLDGIDVTPIAQIADGKVSLTPPFPLASGSHTINIRAANNTQSWAFTIGASAPATDSTNTPAVSVQPETDAEAPPVETNTMPTPESITVSHQEAQKTPRIGPTENGQVSVNTQWASGSNPPDSNVVSIAEQVMYQQGPWSFEVNGSGAISSILNPPPQRTIRNKVNDYILQLSKQHAHWGASLRFGILSSVLFTDSQFVTAAAPHQAAEVTLKTPAGTFGGFANTEDEAAGGGMGINYRQRIFGSSWQAPLPQRVRFRLMWLNAQDIGIPQLVTVDPFGNITITPNPFAPKSSGDAYGGFLNIQISPKWSFLSEYANSHANADIGNSASRRAFGRAWRTMISGQPGKTILNVTYHDVSENFGNPANPTLTPLSQPNMRGLDSSVTQTTNAGTFGLTYTWTQNNVHPISSAELALNSFQETWSKPLSPKTNLSISARQSLTGTKTIPLALLGQAPNVTGAQDMRDLSGTINLSRQVGISTLSASATRDWSHNYYFPLNNSITSALNAGANIVTRGIFQLNGQGSVNWVAANGTTVGSTRNMNANLQPAFLWKKPSIQLSPLINVTQSHTVLSNGTFTSKTLSQQYGGRFAWILPGFWKFNTLSAQGTYNNNHDSINGLAQASTQLFVQWTAVWNHQHTF